MVVNIAFIVIILVLAYPDCPR